MLPALCGQLEGSPAAAGRDRAPAPGTWWATGTGGEANIWGARGTTKMTVQASPKCKSLIYTEIRLFAIQASKHSGYSAFKKSQGNFHNVFSKGLEVSFQNVKTQCFYNEIFHLRCYIDVVSILKQFVQERKETSITFTLNLGCSASPRNSVFLKNTLEIKINQY